MQINIDKVNSILSKKGWSTTQLAVAMDVKESFIYGILHGTHGKTFKTAEKLAKALGVKDKEIIK